MVRRRRDQLDAGRRVAQHRDVVGHLVSGQLAALAGLGALRDFDLDFAGAVEVGRSHAETAGCDLLDLRVRLVPVAVGQEAARVFPAFAGVRAPAEPIHRHRDVLVRLRAERAERHRAGAEAVGDRIVGFDPLKLNGRAVGAEVEQVAQRGRAAIVDHRRELRIRLAVLVLLHRVVQRAPDRRLVGVVIAVAPIAVPTARVEPVHRVGVQVPLQRVGRNFAVADPADPRGRAVERAGDDLLVDPQRLVNLPAEIGRDGGDAHLGHDLEHPGVKRREVVVDHLVQRHLIELALGVQPGQAAERQPGMHGVRAEANQAGDLMHIARVAAAGDDARVEPPAVLDQVVVNSGDREQHRDRRALRTDRFVGQNQRAVAVVDRVVDVVAERVERRFQAGLAVGDGEGRVERGSGETGQAKLADRGEVVVEQDRRGEMDQLRGLGRLFEQRVAPSQPGVERHHVALANRVDRRVGHLRELLLEVGVEQPRRVGQHRERRVVAHRADRLFAVARHRLEHVLDLFFAVAVQDLAFEQLAFAKRLLPARLELDAALNPPHALAHPARIGPLIGDAPLDLVVVQQLATLDVDGDHLAGSEPPGFDDLSGIEVDQPNFRSHHDQPVAGDLIAGRAQAVAIHRRADHPAVRKGDRGRTVPRLGQAGVVLVEAAQARINVRHLLPGLGHEHHHRVQRAAPGGDQQVQRLVEGQRVGAALADHRVQLGDGLAPHIGLQRGAAREHPVAVAQQRVDLTVMCDRPERLRDPPVGQRVGRVALVKERQR